MTAEFLITALIVVVASGTGVIYTLTTGLTRGGWASGIAAFGCTLGIIPHMVAAILGLAALLHTSALAFHLFKYAGLVYLLYLAWSTLKDHRPMTVDDRATAQPVSLLIDSPSIILKGLLIRVRTH